MRSPSKRSPKAKSPEEIEQAREFLRRAREMLKKLCALARKVERFAPEDSALWRQFSALSDAENIPAFVSRINPDASADPFPKRGLAA